MLIILNLKMLKKKLKNYLKINILLTILLLSANWCTAKHLHPEKYYQNEWCSKYYGIQEYKLADKTRVDCVTRNYAIEFDFASKWAECIGQALYYGISTNKKPVCLLIVEKPEDFKYFYRVKRVSDIFNFELWYIKAPEYVYKKK